MISRFVWIVFLVPLAIILIALSVANRAVVSFTLDPFTPGNPLLTLSAPLFMLLFASLAVGLVLGSLATWMAQGRNRKAARSARTEVELLKAEARKREEAMRAAQPALPAR